MTGTATQGTADKHVRTPASPLIVVVIAEWIDFAEFRCDSLRIPESQRKAMRAEAIPRAERIVCRDTAAQRQATSTAPRSRPAPCPTPNPPLRPVLTDC